MFFSAAKAVRESSFVGRKEKNSGYITGVLFCYLEATGVPMKEL